MAIRLPLSFVLFLLLGLCASAQTQGPGNSKFSRRVVPPSPEAGALGVYGNIAPDLNSGAVQLNIPLTTIQGRSLTLPVSLNYHNTGLVVSQIPTWVGHGWTLSAGGVITRTVKGLPDEQPGAGYKDTWRRTAGYRRDGAFNTDLTQNLTTTTDTANRRLLTFCGNASTGVWDTEPDIYSLNFPGYSGSIVFDQTGKYYTNPYSSLKISGDPRTLNSWELRTEDGTRYTFDVTESTNASDVAAHAAATTAWYLSEIISADQSDTIRLEYRANPLSNTVGLNRASKMKLSPGNDNDLGPVRFNSDISYNCNRCEADPDFESGGSSMPSILHTAYLWRISSALTEVTFKSDSLRQDLTVNDPIGRKLQSITVTDRLNQAVKQRFTFSYGYLGAMTSTSTLASKSWRLCLKSVQEVGKPSHVFTYNSLAPPSRDSNSQDHWGFYNGKLNTSTLIPKMPRVLEAIVVNGIKVNNQLADRSADGSFAQAGMLQTVKYPTGGKTTFEYEPNWVTSIKIPEFGEKLTFLDTQVGVFVQRKATTVYPPSPATADSLSEVVRNLLFTGGDQESATGPVPAVSAVMVDLPFGATVNSVIQQNKPPRNAPPYTTQYFFETSLYRIDTTHGTDLDQRYMTLLCRDINTNGTFGGCRSLITLAPGRYLLVAASNANDLIADLRLGLLVNLRPNQTSLPPFERQVGGVRVKQVTDIDGLGNQTHTRYQYDTYDSLTHTSHSSAALYIEPDYADRTPCGRYVISAYDMGLYRFVSTGYHLGYREVTTETDREKAGTTTTYFNNSIIPQLRNLVTQVDLRDNQQRLVKRSTHTYTTPVLGGVSGLHVYQYRIHSRCIDGNLLPAAIDWQINTYTVPIYGIQLAEKKEQQFANGLPSVHQTSTTYHYLPFQLGNTTQPIRTSTRVNGEERISSTRFVCAYDTLSMTDAASTGLRALARRYVLNKPVEELQLIRTAAGPTQVIDGKLTYYSNHQPSKIFSLALPHPVDSTAFLASRVQQGAFQRDGHYQQRVAFLAYDATSNLLHQRLTSAPPEAYLWGYWGTRVVASVQNATPSQIAYTSFEPTSAGQWAFAGTQRVKGGFTGEWAYTLTGQATLQSPVLPAGRYVLSVWIKGAEEVALAGVTNQQHTLVATRPDGWRQHRYTFSVPANGLVTLAASPSQLVYLDEVRLHPVDARMTSYTFDPLVGLTSQTDAANRTTLYEYDAVGRLERVRDEQGRILSQQQYRYARP